MGDEQRGRRGGSELPPYAEELPLATSAPGPDEGLVVELGRPLYEARTWLRIVGVTLFVAAFFTALTIIGVAVAWLPVWMGILLWQAASAALADLSDRSPSNGSSYHTSRIGAPPS